MKTLTLWLSLIFIGTMASAQQSLKISIVDSGSKTALSNATIKLKRLNKQYTSNNLGIVFIPFSNELDTVEISFIGYYNKVFSLKQILAQPVVELEKSSSILEEITISTGYQTKPKAQLTGSFVQVDNALINRRVSTDILSRLEDIAPGLIFNRGILASENDISIRGQSTLFSNAQPLIVLDNFPYEGNISNINPNDIDQITILKDAAAASIWGSRAANGVIVMTSKKAKLNQKLVLNLNSNLTVGTKPDLFYVPKMSSKSYIDIEKFLFNKGYYQARELSPVQAAITPAVELLILNRDGKLSTADLDTQLQQWSNLDVRDDIAKYLYQNSLNQQYSLSVAGGADKYSYRMALGYDEQKFSSKGNSNNRLTFNLDNTVKLIPGRLDWTSNVTLARSALRNNAINANSLDIDAGYPIYPYAQLADGAGQPLNIEHGYRNNWINTARQNGFLDWNYTPLTELNNNNNTVALDDFNLSTAIKYNLFKGLKIDFYYQWTKGSNNENLVYNVDSYYARNLINTFKQSDGTFAVPVAGIRDRNKTSYTSSNYRAQLNYAYSWLKEQELDAFLGLELRDRATFNYTDRDYGFDDLHAVSKPVDYINYYSYAYATAGQLGTIPFKNLAGELSDRYLSAYFNLNYAFKKRYIFTGSIRRDESNLFGVNTNQKGVPLWSLGLAWNLNDEKFCNLKFLPQLKMRLSYGKGGNVNKALSAYATAYYNNGNFSSTKLPYAQITNPPNPELRWEQVATFNLGLDFALKGRILSGSLDFYTKKGVNLIGTIPYPASTGITSFTSNTASMLTKGIDISLNSININNGFKWFTTFLYSYNTDRITRYLAKSAAGNYISFNNGLQVAPLEGYPLYSVFSYPWAGLNASTGDPQGYLNGAPSIDYTKILGTANPENLNFHGSARPVVYGALRNSFTWRNISASVNVSYRLGYFFRRSSVNYIQVLSGYGGHGDFENRWRQAGDEQFTAVPSMPLSINYNRESFYQYASVLVEKGDHIRIQDITLDYELINNKRKASLFNSAKIYLYANNLGFLWRASKLGIDPDYQAGSPPKSLSIGFKANF